MAGGGQNHEAKFNSFVSKKSASLIGLGDSCEWPGRDVVMVALVDFPWKFSLCGGNQGGKFVTSSQNHRIPDLRIT